MVNTHVVLDLDSTLIKSHQIDINRLDEIIKNPIYTKCKDRIRIIVLVDSDDNDVMGKGNLSCFIVILRPYVHEFIKFLFEYFDKVSIWSAGSKRYVRAIESLIIPPENEDYKNKLHMLLTRRDCNEIKHHSVLKDLRSKGFDLNYTLFIDDNHTTFVNNPHNAIHIPVYSPDFKESHIQYDDRTLLKIIQWIKTNNINQCKDIRPLNKSKIFI